MVLVENMPAEAPENGRGRCGWLRLYAAAPRLGAVRLPARGDGLVRRRQLGPPPQPRACRSCRRRQRVGLVAFSSASAAATAAAPLRALQQRRGEGEGPPPALRAVAAGKDLSLPHILPPASCRNQRQVAAAVQAVASGHNCVSRAAVGARGGAGEEEAPGGVFRRRFWGGDEEGEGNCELEAVGRQGKPGGALVWCFAGIGCGCERRGWRPSVPERSRVECRNSVRAKQTGGCAPPRISPPRRRRLGARRGRLQQPRRRPWATSRGARARPTV